MFDTEIRIPTFILKLASLRLYASECHDFNHPHVEAVLLPLELPHFKPYSPGAHPVQPWQCNQ
jgi:hypothetical protein